VPVLARAAPMLGLDLSDLVPAEAAALIAVRDSRVEFRHPLARSAVYGDAPADRRRELHRALASALPDTEADRRAWHLALASFGPDDAASSALEQAGQRACQRSAYEVSSRAFERAARLAPEEARQGRLLYAAADAAWLGGLADRAVALLDRLGAEPWSEMARAELAATGETARRRDVTTLNDLTPQELQIALSLAEGRTTRETAAALFLSPKTIEYHLRSVYRKFDIGSRSELKAAMDRLAAG
jgi:DNA-binding CsgD family transcriptional regulator